MAETEARNKEVSVEDAEGIFAEKYMSRENGIGSLSDEEVIECFEAIPAYDFFSRCRSKHKSEEYAYKQELAPRYYQIMREEGRRIGEEYGVLEDLPYIYGELPDIDKGPELDEWNRRQVAAYEHYELVKSMGVDLTWTEEYYQYAKGRAGLEDLKKETRDNWVSNSEDSVIYKAAGAVPGSVYSFVCYVAGKPIDADSAWYYPSQMTQTIRSTAEDGMGNGFMGEVKKIVYRSGMGMADFGAAQVFTNGHGEILLGVEGYAETAMTGAGRGLSPFAIQGEAAIAGFGDMLMGKVFKKAGSETLAKSMVHAVETGTISSLMNTGADCILAGDKSSIKEEYQECLDAGMSNGEAIVRVGLLEVGKLLENAAQGVISTAGFHGIGKVTTTLGTHMGIIDGPSHVDTNVEDSRNYDTGPEYEETNFETNDRNIYDYDEETAEMYERIYDQQRANNPEYEEFILELRELAEVQEPIYDEYMDPLRVADANGTINSLEQSSRINTEGGTGSSSFEAPRITVNSRGELTNGSYILNQEDMLIHVNGKNPNKSQFLYDVDANKAVLDAAAYADANNLWVSSSGNPADFANKAKVYVQNGPVGVTGKGQLTHYINVYRTKTGYIHGSPGNP